MIESINLCFDKNGNLDGDERVFDELSAFAFGLLGTDERDLTEYTPREFRDAVISFYKKSLHIKKFSKDNFSLWLSEFTPPNSPSDYNKFGYDDWMDTISNIYCVFVCGIDFKEVKPKQIRTEEDLIEKVITLQCEIAEYYKVLLTSREVLNYLKLNGENLDLIEQVLNSDRNLDTHFTYTDLEEEDRNDA